MPSVFADRVMVSTATTGTGTMTLGSAVSGFRTFQAACTAGDLPDGSLVSYAIQDSGGAWETGTGTFANSANTLTRTLRRSSTGSLLSLSGSAQVFITPGALDLQALETPAFTPESASFTAAVNNTYGLTTSSGAITVTLPASPGAGGGSILVADISADAYTNNVTITPNGSDNLYICNSTGTLNTLTSLICDINNFQIELVAVSGGWNVKVDAR